MKVAATFQDLEHLYDFQTFGCGGHFVFQYEAKILQRHLCLAINISHKFGEDIFRCSGLCKNMTGGLTHAPTEGIL